MVTDQNLQSWTDSDMMVDLWFLDNKHSCVYANSLHKTTGYVMQLGLDKTTEIPSLIIANNMIILDLGDGYNWTLHWESKL